MQYVSGIIKNNGERVDREVHANWSPFEFLLEVTSLETGEVWAVAPSDKMTLSGKVLGVAYDLLPSQSVFIVHSKAQALLYKHILTATSNTHTSELAFYDTDMARLYGSVVRNTGRTKIAIDTLEDEYKVGGLCGSVCVVYETVADHMEVYNLCDFLMELCRILKMSVFDYEDITLYSNKLKFSTVVRLSQTPESRRFFTKLCVAGFGG